MDKSRGGDVRAVVLRCFDARTNLSCKHQIKLSGDEIYKLTAPGAGCHDLQYAKASSVGLIATHHSDRGPRRRYRSRDGAFWFVEF